MKLKCLILLVSLLMQIGVCAQGTLKLNAGESFTYEFSSVQLVGLTFPDPPFLTYGSLGCFFSPASVPGSTMLWEMFATSVSDSPIASQVVGVPVFPQPPNPPPIYANAGWQDLQGIVRLSTLTGSATLSQVRISVVRSEAGNLFRYSSLVPIPEPKPFVIFCAGGAFLLVTRLARKWRHKVAVPQNNFSLR